MIVAKDQHVEFEPWQEAVRPLVEFFQDKVREVIGRFVREGIYIVESLPYAETFGIGCLDFVDVFPLEQDASIVQVELDVFSEVQVDLLDDGVDEIFQTNCGYSAGPNFSEQVIIAFFGD